MVIFKIALIILLAGPFVALAIFLFMKAKQVANEQNKKERNRR